MIWPWPHVLMSLEGGWMYRGIIRKWPNSETMFRSVNCNSAARNQSNLCLTYLHHTQTIPKRYWLTEDVESLKFKLMNDNPALLAKPHKLWLLFFAASKAYLKPKYLVGFGWFRGNHTIPSKITYLQLQIDYISPRNSVKAGERYCFLLCWWEIKSYQAEHATFF